jgi:hypothetical protein
MISCDHWSQCGINNGGCCAADHYGGKPSFGVCNQCPHRVVDGALIAPRTPLELSRIAAIAETKSQALAYTAAELMHATQGPASEADAAARLAICMACEHRSVSYKGQTDESGVGWCTKCGCGNNPRAMLTVKVTLAGVECPLAKWGKVEGTGATVASAVDAVAGVAKSIIHKLSGG